MISNLKSFVDLKMGKSNVVEAMLCKTNFGKSHAIQKYHALPTMVISISLVLKRD